MLDKEGYIHEGLLHRQDIGVSHASLVPWVGKYHFVKGVFSFRHNRSQLSVVLLQVRLQLQAYVQAVSIEDGHCQADASLKANSACCCLCSPTSPTEYAA